MTSRLFTGRDYRSIYGTKFERLSKVGFSPDENWFRFSGTKKDLGFSPDEISNKIWSN